MAMQCFLLAAVKRKKVSGQVRIKLGHDLKLIDESIYKFCWIVDFPMYELSDEGKLIFLITHFQCRKVV